ncbi:hypothetical protein ACOSP6_16620 [Tenacibaculum sp. MEBiC06402]|uniref:hypothetical protein n=1 Tax=unclassified Tenacibaculum TaxID=2635139 RepID=UPI003B9BE9FC
MKKSILELGTVLNKSQQIKISGGLNLSTGGVVCVTCGNGYQKCCTGGKSPSVNCATKSGSCVKTQIPSGGDNMM